MSTNVFNPAMPELVVEGYFQLVKSIAGRIKRRLPAHVDVEDLIQTGVIGLLEASGRYDATRSVNFSSYANSRITGAILDELRKWDTCSRQDRATLRQAETAKDRLRACSGQEPTREGVAEAVGLGLAEYECYLQRSESRKQAVPQGTDQDLEAADPVSLLPSKDENPMESCLKKQESELLKSNLLKLKPRHRDVLQKYYFEDLGLKEIGDQMGVGEARVSQRHRQALVALRGVTEKGRKPAPRVSTMIQ